MPSDHKRVVCLSYAAFLALFFNSPNRTKLSPVATRASSFERGAQPSTRLAFSLEAFFFFASSGRISFVAGSRKARRAVQLLGTTLFSTD